MVRDQSVVNSIPEAGYGLDEKIKQKYLQIDKPLYLFSSNENNLRHILDTRFIQFKTKFIFMLPQHLNATILHNKF